MSHTKEFLSFIGNSPSPFHAVSEAKKRLISAGFKEIKERTNFKSQGIIRNGKYFFTRNQSAIVAFAVGGKYVPGNGFSIVGAHTDSPCLKVKPVSKREKGGYLQVGVEVYGGGIWHTWFDRDLSIAGRVLVNTGPNQFEHRLVKITKPILRIPNLAIHLTSGDDRTAFSYNKEVQLTPILGTVAEKLNGVEKKDGGDGDASVKHHPVLLNLIAKEMDIKVDQIGDFELCLYDTHAPQVGGINDEFIFSARLDNLGMSFCALTGLINATKLDEDPNVRMITLFDNEEVGSVSTAGADSNLLEATLKRLTVDLEFELLAGEVSSLVSDDNDGWILVNDDKLFSSKTASQESLVKSMLISADMAHGLHPNYMEKHEDNHRPIINKGVVIKENANQRYATTSVTKLFLKEIAKKRNVPLQEFVVRNDSPCGSTIGPVLSANLGIRTVDIGNPQWAMHSIRETCGVSDIGYAVDLFESFFEEFAFLEARVFID